MKTTLIFTTVLLVVAVAAGEYFRPSAYTILALSRWYNRHEFVVMTFDQFQTMTMNVENYRRQIRYDQEEIDQLRAKIKRLSIDGDSLSLK